MLLALSQRIVCDIINLFTNYHVAHFNYILEQLSSLIDGWGNSCEIVWIQTQLDLIDDKSILVPVRVWCRQTTSHNLSQCWPRSMSLYAGIRPWWVNGMLHQSCRQFIICSKWESHIMLCSCRRTLIGHNRAIRPHYRPEITWFWEARDVPRFMRLPFKYIDNNGHNHSHRGICQSTGVL